MSFTRNLRKLQRAEERRDYFGHWVRCLPVFLVLAFLSLRQIDLYPPTPDEFFSMFNSGWLVNAPYSPGEIIESLYTNSPTHLPAYFFALSAWGNITAFDVALGRALGVFFGLLSLAVVYRLARDFVAPAAGLFAIIIVASNAFYSFYIPHVRMYACLVLMSGIVLWLYLRIVYRLKRAAARHYIAFGASVYVLANIHAFGAIFALALGVFHVIMVQKDRRWWRLSLAAGGAGLLVLPYAFIFLSKGMERYVVNWGEHSVGFQGALEVWLKAMTNGQPLLLLLPLAGISYGVRRRSYKFQPYFLLIVFFLMVLGIIAQFTQLVTADGMRHFLPGMLPLVLAVAMGLHALYSIQRRLGLLVLLWVAAGLWFQHNADWEAIIAGRTYAFNYPPWQIVSRQASRADRLPVVFVSRIPAHRLTWESYIHYSQKNYYFDERGVSIGFVDSPGELRDNLLQQANPPTDVWIAFMPSTTKPDKLAGLEAMLEDWDYQLCDIERIGASAFVWRYSWKGLLCEARSVPPIRSNDLLDYQLYYAGLDASQLKIRFVDEWSWRGGDDIGRESFQMSHQLMSPGWDKVAQVDLPLVDEGMPRRFSMDVSDVEPGDYRLVAILYNYQTGERIHWRGNDGLTPDMLTLAEIGISERS